MARLVHVDQQRWRSLGHGGIRLVVGPRNRAKRTAERRVPRIRRSGAALLLAGGAAVATLPALAHPRSSGRAAQPSSATFRRLGAEAEEAPRAPGVWVHGRLRVL